MTSLLTSAWQGVLGYYARSLLTVLGLCIGLLSLVIVTSGSSAVQSVIEQRAVLTNGGKYSYTVVFDDLTSYTDALSAQALLEASIGDDVIVALSQPDAALSLVSRDGGAIPDVSVVDDRVRKIRPFPLLHGAWLTNDKVLAPQVVVNSAAVGSVDLPSSTGWSLMGETGARVSATVIGVVNDGQTQPAAYVSFDQLASVTGDPVSARPLQLTVSGPALRLETLKGLFDDYRAFGSPFTATDISRSDRVDDLAAETSSTQRVFVVIVLLALAGSVISILNIGLAAARERAVELSLRRALGATRLRILAVILIETQIIAVVAWLVAVAVSALLYPFVAVFFGVPSGIALPPYPVSVALLGLAVGSAASFLGGFIPAIRAARTNLSTVMRA